MKFLLTATLILSIATVSAQDNRQEFDVADQLTRTLSWVAPTTRINGAELSASELLGFRLYSGQDKDQLEVFLELDTDITEYTFNLVEGSTFYAISAVDTLGTESDLSVIKEVYVIDTSVPVEPTAPDDVVIQ